MDFNFETKDSAIEAFIKDNARNRNFDGIGVDINSLKAKQNPLS